MSYKDYRQEQKENNQSSYTKYRRDNQGYKQYRQEMNTSSEDSTVPGWIGTTFDIISRPQYASSNLAETTIDSIVKGEKFQPFKAVGEGLSGKDKGSYIEIANEYMPEGTPQWVKSGVGLAGDIMLDPLDLLGVGLLNDVGKVATKVDDSIRAVKSATKIDDITKLDDPIEAIFKHGDIAKDSKIGRKVMDIADKYGVETLKKGKTLSEQARKGQRGLVNIAGKSILPKAVDEQAFRIMGKGSDAFKQTDIYQDLAEKFSTKYNVPDDVQEVKKKYDRIENLKKQEAVQQAKDLENKITEITDDFDVSRQELSKYIEMPEEAYTGTRKQLPDKVGEFTDLIRQEQKKILDLEQQAGIPVQKLEDEDLEYFAHILTPEARKVVDTKARKNDTLLNELLNTIQHGSTKGRKYKNMTIDEINDLARKGELEGFEGQKISKFFEDDPVKVQAIRNLKSAKARTSANFLRELGERFGNVEGGVELSKAVKPLNENLAKVLEGKKFDKEVADYITRYIDKTRPKNISKFLDTYDSWLQTWKKGTLLPIPGFHVRNAFDNAWKNFLGDVNMGSYKDLAKLETGAVDEIVTETGEKITKEQFDDMLTEYGITDSGFVMKNVGDSLEDSIRKSTDRGLKEKIMGSVANPIETGRRVGRFNENSFRKAHFLDKLKKGFSPEDAKKSVSKYLFDYGDLTDFEANTMKRLMPFYTFTRKNLPLQLQMLVEKPSKIATIPKTIRGINTLSEPPEDASAMPEWLKDSAKVRVPDALSPDDDPSYMTLDNWVSTMDLLKFSSPEEAISTTANLLSPMIKMPLEQSINRSFFTRRPIQEYEGEKEDYLGYPVDTNYKKALDILPGNRVLNEINRLNPANVFGTNKQRPNQDSWNERLLRAITGLKSYPYQEDKSKYFKEQSQRATYRKILNDYKQAKARNNKDKAKALEEELRKFIEQNTQ